MYISSTPPSRYRCGMSCFLLQLIVGLNFERLDSNVYIMDIGHDLQNHRCTWHTAMEERWNSLLLPVTNAFHNLLFTSKCDQKGAWISKRESGKEVSDKASMEEMIGDGPFPGVYQMIFLKSQLRDTFSILDQVMGGEKLSRWCSISSWSSCWRFPPQRCFHMRVREEISWIGEHGLRGRFPEESLRTERICGERFDWRDHIKCIERRQMMRNKDFMMIKRRSTRIPQKGLSNKSQLSSSNPFEERTRPNLEMEKSQGVF